MVPARKSAASDVTVQAPQDCPNGGALSDLSSVHMQKAEAASAKPEGGKEGAEVQDTSLPGMTFMMECYEGELKRPIRNLVNGRLLRTILIQVRMPSKGLWECSCVC